MIIYIHMIDKISPFFYILNVHSIGFYDSEHSDFFFSWIFELDFYGQNRCTIPLSNDARALRTNDSAYALY